MFKDETSVTVRCGNKTINTKLNGTGRIKMLRNCEIITQHSKVRATTLMQSNTAEKIQLLKVNVLPGQEISKQLRSNLIETKIKTLEDSVMQSQQFWHNAHHYMLIYGIIIVSIIVIRYFYVKLELAPDA